MGLPDKLFDLLDERPFLPSQFKQLTEPTLGCLELPEPDLEPDEVSTHDFERLGSFARALRDQSW